MGKPATLRFAIARDIEENPRFNSFTDSGNAERFADLARGQLLWCVARHWFEWDGRRWQRRTTDAAAQQVAKRVIFQLYRDAARASDDKQRKALAAFALQSERANRRSAMVQLGKAEPGMEVSVADFDRDPWLLNVQNGTIDLRSGELRPHCRNDLITKLCPVSYEPGAAAPGFLRFLQEVFGEDDELVGYVQRLAGYALTGDVSEHVIAFWWGAGRNGKTTLLEILRAILGEYALTGAMDLLIAKRGARLDNLAATNLADLQGKRLVTVEELPQGARLDENLVKNMTGGGEINACRKFENAIQFSPTHKFLVATNYRPRIVGTDQGIWRRVHLLPFCQEFVLPHEAEELSLDYEALPTGMYKADPAIKATLLHEEAPGILAWLAEGTRAWLSHGTAPPETVRAAVRAYRDQEDLLGQFLDERCLIDPAQPQLETRSSDLQAALSRYIDESGGRRPNRNELADRLRRAGCRDCRIGHQGHRGWRGVGLISDREGPQE